MASPFRDDVLKDKVAFMAGATSGINLGVAERFAELGAKVFVISRSVEKVAATVEVLKAKGADADGQSVDVRHYDPVADALKACRDTFGKIDFVLSGAAGNFVAPALGMSSNGFKTVVDIDLIGTYNVCRASFEHLNTPGASIVNITAPQAEQAYIMQSHVCAAKAGINMLTKCLALEWGQMGVRVNAVSPGPIEGTEGMKRLAPTPEAEQRARDAVALKRYGTPYDIAEACVFLGTEASSYITGEIMYVDGGMVLGDGGLSQMGG